MSKKKSSSEPGFAKLLDAWNPPQDCGAPVGCLATSFTFSPAFFEEECLARFLQIESDPDEDGPVYLVEREEKMSQLMAAIALVDQRHCRGTRSLRWDLLSARLRAGILHSKVSLLCWASRIRLIIASANLTEDGYRRNQEVFGVIDFHLTGEAPVSCLLQTIDFLRETGLLADSSAVPSPGRRRWDSLLDHAVNMAASWGQSAGEHEESVVKVVPVFTGLGRTSLFDQMKSMWPAASPPKAAHVVSPFFDTSPNDNRPASELWQIVRQRGEATVHFHVTAEEISGTDELLLHAPKSLLGEKPAGRPATETLFHRLLLPPERPLHAKAIWLEDDRYDAYLIGSSNFTSAGTGLKGNASNVEANLLYLADTNRDEKIRNQLGQSFPKSEPLKITTETRWTALPDESESPTELVLLPPEFLSATFTAEDPADPLVLLTFQSPLAFSWQLLFEDSDEVFFDSKMWANLGSPVICEVLWHEERAPSGFRVKISEASETAWWPVNVLSSSDLPPIKELKNLSLEMLIEILSSARPLHHVLAAYLRKTAKGTNDAVVLGVVDPHKKVDTGQFLLQRTRRLSWALNALRERLQRPAATIQSLQWRLCGPVGVKALAEALIRESHSEEETAFVISELALELSRVTPEQALGCLSLEIHLKEIRNVIQNLMVMIPTDLNQLPTNLRDYVEAVFAKVSK
jgi:hypothetical protein